MFLKKSVCLESFYVHCKKKLFFSTAQKIFKKSQHSTENFQKIFPVLSFSPPKRGLALHGGHFGQDAPQMPSLIALIPPSELFISGTLVCIEILVQILKHILQTIIFLSYYTDKDCTGTTITVMKGV